MTSTVAKLQPMVSIIVAMYNSAKYIAPCINSLKQFSFSDYEVLIGDDESSDDSVTKAQQAINYDTRFTVYQLQHGGISITRNTLISKARGKYLLFLDSDDLFNPDTLAIMVHSLERSASQICIAKYQRLLNGRLEEPGYWIQNVHSIGPKTVSLAEYPQLLCLILAHGKLFNRQWWNKNGFTFPPHITYEDQIVNTLCFLTAQSIDIIPQSLVYWCIREDQTSVTQNIRLLSDVQARVDAFNAALRILIEHGDDRITQERIAQYLAYYIPEILRGLDYTRDYTEHLKVIEQFVERYYFPLPTQFAAEIPPVVRVAYEFYRLGYADLGVRWILKTSLLNQNVYYLNRNGRPGLDVTKTFRELGMAESIPPELIEQFWPLTEAQVFPIYYIQRRIRWGTFLYVKGWAFLADIDPGLFDYSVQAKLICRVQNQLKEIPLPIKIAANPKIRKLDRNPTIDFSSRGFSGFRKIPAGISQLRLVLSITAGGYIRSVVHEL
jgi:CDP-glycerol glycerophosphotransferase